MRKKDFLILQSFNVHYFDGRSSIPKSVTLELHDTFVQIRELNLSYNFKDIEVRAKLNNTPQSVTFSDGSYCMLDASDFFSLPNSKEAFILKIESKMRYALMSFAILGVFTAFCLTYGAAMAANILAPQIPKSAVERMSAETLELLDKQYMSASKTDEKKRDFITKQFNALLNKNGNLKLHFRSSAFFGANAFALPNGDIVLFDDLIEIEKDKEFRGIIGVLAHESGHVAHMHGLKMLIKSSISSALIGYLTGDISGFIASFTTMVIDAKYSREYENEADLYAMKVMKNNNIPAKYMADLFDEIAKKDTVSDNATLKSLISSHPAIEERIKKFREN
ncbi:MAG: M48 family metallopeptidase [Campylobacteraceae bacterium]|jgi:Zn-dependent protease with chaperone function|nr:M48 family metallopeptidase [Campylobacteraceae bacterium]